MKTTRRKFLKTAAAGAMIPATLPIPQATLRPPRIAIIRPRATAATAVLARALKSRGCEVSEFTSDKGVSRVDQKIFAAPFAGIAEGFGLTMTAPGELSVVGGDARGQTYGFLELADRVEHLGMDAFHAIAVGPPVLDHPTNPVRAVSRLFVSDHHDKPWFNDREMWPEYFEMLAKNRFNRFHLALGIGYDFLRQVTDCYFVFAYPFFVSPPGYNVRAVGLSDAERDRNLETLRYISTLAGVFNLDFQLGIWTHGYQWENSPHANFTIEGLTPETHAAYCRDALAMILRACPAITGVTFRIHGESGVAEGNYPFWRTVFEGVEKSGRTIEIDLHSKGLDEKMLATALDTKMPVTVSPKFWAEHMGMPYHQADIRELEIPKGAAKGLMALSTGERSFTRYGYADLLRADRKYRVIHRIWSGSRRILLWGDASTAAQYSRAFGFCGSEGVDLMEPLSFKGRRGSGVGSRCGYASSEPGASLEPRWDWQKFLYTYRIWGRAMYNPASAPGDARRLLATQFGKAAPDVETALGHATRILPTITTAHLPSAANNNYWPEIYTNQPIVAPGKNQYSDTPSPKTFGNTSPLDPQLFLTVNQCAAEILSGERSGKYSPVDVAQWIEGDAAAALEKLAAAEKKGAKSVEFRRLAVDVRIQAGIGQFFASKLRAGVFYAIFATSGDRAALDAAAKQYRTAIEAWKQTVSSSQGVYAADITAGEQPWLRGNWADRMPAMEADLADMQRTVVLVETHPDASASIAQVLAVPRMHDRPCTHTPPLPFARGGPVPIEMKVLGTQSATATLWYRHVNQAERFQSVAMEPRDDAFHATIPSEYTDSPYSIQYYFQVKEGKNAWLYPGFAPGFDRPYFVTELMLLTRSAR